ncbi:hypothetical protein [Pseudonocardia sp. HH130630-07]|uniref:hypothetical protein n=1 Tax=Pseudonocardia sp. HH130630-07 TaxID=1690815 RepID=UPI000814D856|nr:hypothetical protein [Pseudonocardia sp. HH130630-07]ANY08338.1 hypothetical protein AFB00_20975 [Pseudonocardia sp. HH130630-07]
MRVVGYAFPWDVTAPGFLDRVAEAGVTEVAVATAYHSVRAATPWSDTGTAVLARHAALYRPLRPERWPGDLRPGVPDWAGSADPAGDAVRLLGRAGVPAAAWTVLTHDSRLGTEHPELSVRNCFGERYPWALCPAQPRVREHAATLAAESVSGLDVGSVVLEACGQLGALHQCHHEKTDATWSPAAARLLSICFCDACEAGLEDAAGVRAAVRDAARRLLASGDLTATADGLDERIRTRVLAARHRATDVLRARVLDALPGGLRTALHAASDPWATGALPGVTERTGPDVGTVVVPAWQPETSVEAVRAARTLLPSGTVIGAYLTTVAPAAEPGVASRVAALHDAGADELHLYHLGLAGPARWAQLLAATGAASAVRKGLSTP